MSAHDRDAARESPDDVERLLTHLEPPPVPPRLAARVLAQTTRAPRARWSAWLTLALLGGLLAAGLAAVSGYLTGRELVQSGALELLRFGLEERDLIAAAPQEYVQALVEAIPWSGLLATLVCVLGAVAATRPLASAPERATG